MTIDKALLHSDGGLDDILSSLRRRNRRLDTAVTNEEYLEGVQSIGEQLSRLQHDLGEERVRLKQQQSKLDPRHRDVSAVDGDVVRLIKQQVGFAKNEVRRKTKLVAEQQKVLDQKFRLIDNLLDGDIHSRLKDVLDSYDSDEDGSCNLHLAVDIVVLDPLFCLGGYEVLSAEGGLPLTYLTDPGVTLSESIVQYAVFRLGKLAESMALSLPDQLVALAQNGRSLDSTLLAFLHFHSGKTYWDRQLPFRRMAIASTSTPLHPSATKERPDMWCDNVVSRDIFFVCFVGSTLEESRQEQLSMVKIIRDFYETLLVGCDSDRSDRLLRCKAVDATDLLPYEASRIAVEGHIKRLDGVDDWTLLGYVSNCTDYLSRDYRIRMGSSIDKRDCVHFVHGCFCRSTLALEWLLQANTVQYENEIGVVLPVKALGESLPLQRWGCERDEAVRASPRLLFLPFCRRWTTKKQSKKRIVEDLKECGKARLLADKVQGSTEGCNPKAPTKTDKRPPFALDRFPTPQETLHEATSCPFDFLPIGHN